MKLYNVSAHAIKRAVERLGQPEFNAKNCIVQLMQTAYYVGTTPQPDGRMAKVFDHYKSRTRLIVGENDTIITVYKFPEVELTESKPTVFADEIKRLVKRQFDKVKREFTRNRRALEIQLAELNIEVAHLQLNKAKARSPKVQTSLQVKINELLTRQGTVSSAIESAKHKFDEIKRGAEAYL